MDVGAVCARVRGGAWASLGAGHGEIPAASAGMTELGDAGMTDLGSAGMTELGARVWRI